MAASSRYPVSMTCTASGTVQVGQYANVGTASGTSPGGTTRTDSDLSHYTSAEPPECQVEMVTHVSQENAPKETEIKLDQIWAQTFSHTSGDGTYASAA